MIYNWNIDQWANNELPVDLRDSNGQNFEWQSVLLLPVKFLYNKFITYRADTVKKMRYNGQIIILEHLLNDLFDPIHKRIYIQNAGDLLSGTYIYLNSEENPLPVYTKAEYEAEAIYDAAHGVPPILPKNYLYTSNEFGNAYDFIVYAADNSLSHAQIVRLKAVVQYYKIAGKRAQYQYIINHQTF